MGGQEDFEEEEVMQQDKGTGKSKGQGKASPAHRIPISTPTRAAKEKTAREPAKCGRAGPAVGRGRAKRKRAGGDETTESFGIYIHRLLNQVRCGSAPVIVGKLM